MKLSRSDCQNRLAAIQDVALELAFEIERHGAEYGGNYDAYLLRMQNLLKWCDKKIPYMRVGIAHRRSLELQLTKPEARSVVQQFIDNEAGDLWDTILPE